jgi:hypothetical protein
MLKYSQWIWWPEQGAPKWIIRLTVAIWREQRLKQCIGRVE